MYFGSPGAAFRAGCLKRPNVGNNPGASRATKFLSYLATWRGIGVSVHWFNWELAVKVDVGVLVHQCIINVVSMHYQCIIGTSEYRCCLAYWSIVVAVKSKKLY